MQEANGRIVVLGTGGTIAGEALDPRNPLQYQAGSLGLEQLLARVSGLPSARLVVEDVARVDSKDMDWEVWRLLARRCAHWLAQPGVRGLVVTHGTDTLEETAWLLQRVLAPARPVVLASAMLPATDPRTDGPRNLRDAVAVAGAPDAAGVLAVCAGQVHGAREVRKVHPVRLDAFGSGDAGPLATVKDGAVRLLREWPSSTPEPGLLDKLLAAPQPWVEVVHSHAGATRKAVDLLVQAGVQGMVVAATGNGTVHAALQPALLEAMARGVRVVRGTRCLEGSVVAQPADPVPAHPLTPAKARVDLLLDLLG